MTPPTPPQLAVLAFYRDFLARHDRPPSLREAADALGVKHQTIQYHCQRLVAAGLMAHLHPHPTPRRGLYTPASKAQRIP